MDPVTMAAIGTAVTAGATALGAVAKSNAMEAEGKAGVAAAKQQAEWDKRRALEERVAAQHAAGQETRKAKLAQSRLTALAGGSGSGVDDAGVMDLWGDIEKEGQYNASMATAAGEQRATGLTYGADLSRWKADAQNRIAKSGARATLIGGLMSAAGQGMTGYGNMSARYPVGSTATSYRYGS